ncbi:hypothetical protein HMPREF0731_3229 [Pseudoroseomonas cervicalis ATCC 49957]|uniref:Uncharacterized protein n=1 Tax=Pseudoroseomonas cervicalis ATCC 49957 TaxID=525371 RepID=D5RQ67_9PROT|nr:hypothetical protein HMPREF0731_3229 [Pseudoroseomonas cervicalis ATCC 49957]
MLGGLLALACEAVPLGLARRLALEGDCRRLEGCRPGGFAPSHLGGQAMD